jgi:hypothetical protein
MGSAITVALFMFVLLAREGCSETTQEGQGLLIGALGPITRTPSVGHPRESGLCSTSHGSQTFTTIRAASIYAEHRYRSCRRLQHGHPRFHLLGNPRSKVGTQIELRAKQLSP